MIDKESRGLLLGFFMLFGFGGLLGGDAFPEIRLIDFLQLAPPWRFPVAMAAKGTIAAIAAGGALPIAIGGRGDDACLHGIADFLRARGNEIQNGGILLLGCEI